MNTLLIILIITNPILLTILLIFIYLMRNKIINKFIQISKHGFDYNSNIIIKISQLSSLVANNSDYLKELVKSNYSLSKLNNISQLIETNNSSLSKLDNISQLIETNNSSLSKLDNISQLIEINNSSIKENNKLIEKIIQTLYESVSL